MTSIISGGTVTVTNGSVTVTGTGTAFATSSVENGLILVGGTAAFVASVESETSLTLTKAWSGATAADTDYEIQRTNSAAASAVDANDRLAEIARRVQAGTFLQPDAFGTLAGRSAYDDAAEGAVYVVPATSEGGSPTVYVKNSDTNADWSAGQSFQGPKGDAGNPLATTTAFAETLLDDADAPEVLTTLGVSAFSQTLLDDADAAAARATLNIGNPGYVTVLSGDHTITAADRGRLFYCQASGTLTLPDSATVGEGFSFSLRAQIGLVTLVRSGSDTLNGGTTIYFAETESATITTDGAGNWYTVIRAGHIAKRMELLATGTTYSTQSTSDANLSDMLTYTPRNPQSSTYMVTATARCLVRNTNGGDDSNSVIRLASYDAGGSGSYNTLVSEQLGNLNVQPFGASGNQIQLNMTVPLIVGVGAGQIDSNGQLQLRLRGAVFTSSDREILQYGFRAMITEYQNA